jgi:hypothetical protein
MPPRDLERVAGGSQVDRCGPGEEKPDVAVDRVADECRQIEVDLSQPGVDGGRELRRELGKALNARRERITRTVQALLLSVVPRGPSGLRSRRRFVAPLVVRRSSRAGPVRGRVSPYPSPVPLPE